MLARVCQHAKIYRRIAAYGLLIHIFGPRHSEKSASGKDEEQDQTETRQTGQVQDKIEQK
jgi:hypothetical protein